MQNQFVDFWQSRYDEGVLPWDLAGPSPHFVALAQNEPTLFRGKWLVPGAGRGHDAAFIASLGADVLAIDYASGAKSSAAKLYADLNFIEADIFKLDASYHDQFDGVLEHTCFCAINPKYRRDYALMASQVLKPDGQLLGVFWEHGDPDGPPFSTTQEEIRSVFEPYFKEIQIVPTLHNAASRSGQEYLVRMRAI